MEIFNWTGGSNYNKVWDLRHSGSCQSFDSGKIISIPHRIKASSDAKILLNGTGTITNTTKTMQDFFQIGVTNPFGTGYCTVEDTGQTITFHTPGSVTEGR